MGRDYSLTAASQGERHSAQSTPLFVGDMFFEGVCFELPGCLNLLEANAVNKHGMVTAVYLSPNWEVQTIAVISTETVFSNSR